MIINTIPGVYYNENMTYELTGAGSKIPVFIGVSGLTSEVNYSIIEEGVSKSVTHKIDGSQVLTFKNYNSINQPVNEGGLGTEFTVNGDVVTSNLGTNKLLNRIKEFYEEAKLVTSGDIGVPYIYVIDVGNGKNLASWKKALETAKTLHDATVEVYVGPYLKTTGTGENQVTTVNITDDELLTSFLNRIYYGKDYNGSVDTEDDFGLKDCEKNLDLRYAFTTIELDDNTRMIDDILKSITNTFQESRIGLCEPLLFGKTIARICCTPNNTEPGFFVYRSVKPGSFNQRTRHDMLELQNAGIIFNSDEHINGKVYPKLNLCVATSFAKSTARPADALFHARFNCDDLLREVFEACYTQIKNNESATNISYLQTRINKIVNDRVVAEEMIKYNDKEGTGTRLFVSESDANPYNLIVSGQLQPVKCTIAIDVRATIKI